MKESKQTKEERQQVLSDYVNGKSVKGDGPAVRTLTVRMTPEEYDHLKRLADACRTSVSDMVRQLCTGASVKAIPPEASYDVLDLLFEIRDAIREDSACGRDVGDNLTRAEKLINDFTAKVDSFYDGIDGVAYGACVRESMESELSPEELAEWKREYEAWKEMKDYGND